MNLVAFVASLRHPSFTGRNRDPGFVVATVAVLSLLGVGADRLVPAAGAVVVLVGLALLLLRGYAVPGTPWVVRALSRRERRPLPAPDPVAAGESELLRAGVLDHDPATDELRLSASFLDAWTRRVRAAGPRETDARALAAALGVDPGPVGLTWRNGVLVADVAGRPAAAWLSRAALLADTASIAELRRRCPRWDEFTPERRGGLCATLRLYLDVCPACDGRTVLDRAPSRAPGATGLAVAVTCADCDARLFEGGFPTDARSVGGRSSSVVGRRE
jgi:hypothetical protein